MNILVRPVVGVTLHDSAYLDRLLARIAHLGVIYKGVFDRMNSITT